MCTQHSFNVLCTASASNYILYVYYCVHNISMIELPPLCYDFTLALKPTCTILYRFRDIHISYIITHIEDIKYFSEINHMLLRTKFPLLIPLDMQIQLDICYKAAKWKILGPT